LEDIDFVPIAEFLAKKDEERKKKKKKFESMTEVFAKALNKEVKQSVISLNGKFDVGPDNGFAQVVDKEIRGGEGGKNGGKEEETGKTRKNVQRILHS